MEIHKLGVNLIAAGALLILFCGLSIAGTRIVQPLTGGSPAFPLKPLIQLIDVWGIGLGILVMVIGLIFIYISTPLHDRTEELND